MGAISGNGVSIEEALPLDGSRPLEGPLTIDQNSNAISLDIDSEATTADIVNISASTLTNGIVIDVPDADALVTGKIASFFSNSADVTGRNLVEIRNVNSSATGATPLRVRQAAANKVVLLTQNAASSFIDYAGTAAGNATDPISTLTTSGATTHHLQIEINGVKAWIAVSTTDPS